MPRILVTGASGFLGSILCRLAREEGYAVWGTFFSGSPGNSAGIRQERLDLKDESRVIELVNRVLPEVVIHTAYSQKEREVTYHGTRRLVEACVSLAEKPYFVFLSTDLVFDGKKGFYREEDEPAPVLDYGRHKLEAERIVRAVLPNSLVVRTSLLYDLVRVPNHLKFAVKAIDKGRSFTFFQDEFRSPMLVDELARALLDLARMRPEGVLHMAGRDRLDRWSFGTGLLAALGFSTVLVGVSSLHDCGENRPADCSLDSSCAESILNRTFCGARELLKI